VTSGLDFQEQIVDYIVFKKGYGYRLEKFKTKVQVDKFINLVLLANDSK
jgi:hypothetical protein